ncbi:MAG: carboxylating nicotinate-nucleotide diphosphorylase [Candidatus Magasanikbacteria bacterium]
MNKSQLIKKYYNQKNKLTLKNPVYLRQFNKLIKFILEEDLNNIGDITTNTLIAKNFTAHAVIIAKEAGILSGIEEVLYITKKYKVKTKVFKKDKDKIKKNETIMTLSGGIKDLLVIERLIINIIQRMSGIATKTNRVVKTAGDGALIVSTRKTLWGLLDKRAVTAGGGGTHRLGLYDFMLIKDNHLNFINAENLKKIKTFWEVEVTNEEELKMAITNNASAIMFDNFASKDIQKLISKYFNKLKNTILEASGMITEKNIKQYANSGVDIISIGKLTRSAQTIDISMKIRK